MQAITIRCLFSIILIIAFAQMALCQTEIRNWNDLNDIRLNLLGEYVLMNDIGEHSAGYADFNTGIGWLPIGTNNDRFTGTFNGNGFAIGGLSIDIDRGLVGLFGDIDNATIKNLGVVNANVTSTGAGTGVLAGRAFGSTITNVYTTGNVATSGGHLIGGLVGLLADESIVSDCWSSVEVTAGATNNVGGLAGTLRTNAAIKRSFATGNVKSTGGNVGGLVGNLIDNATSITDSYARGEVEGDSRVGGLVGNSTNETIITNTYSTGLVTGNTLVGGFIGSNSLDGTVNNSYWDTQTSAISAGTGRITTPTTFNYKKGDSYSLDITVYSSNSTSTNSPAIVFFFGGGWVSGSINQFVQHARYFAQRGMTSVLVDYRVTQRHNSTPFDSVDDAVDALNFVFKNSDQLKIDKNNVVVSGGSAGGHLALMSSFRVMNEHNFKPATLVVFNSVVDTGPDGYGYDIIGENYKDISPIDNVPTNPPPVINFQGTSDNLISVNDAENFCQEVKRKNGICELKLYQGQGHGFWNYNRSIEYFKETILAADLFLIQNNVIGGNPNIDQWIEEN